MFPFAFPRLRLIRRHLGVAAGAGLVSLALPVLAPPLSAEPAPSPNTVSAQAPRSLSQVTQEQHFFPAQIDGRTYQLEAMLYRPQPLDATRHPLVIFSHGRYGPHPARNPNEVNGYAEICTALAAEGNVVVFLVRRGYGNSDGPDVELQDTAVLSGLEAAKDYKAAVAYWRTKDYVLPGKVVLMGHSQGGWDALACSNVPMEGVLGTVNISGGTNYASMGSGAITSAVQDHWVAGAGDLGRGALVPTFWIYAENDQAISGPTSRRMFESFKAGGGNGFQLMLPAFGSNGHDVVSRPDLFLPQLDDFLATIGFRDEPTAAPSIVTVLGGGAVNAGSPAVMVVYLSANPLPTLQWRKDGVALANGGNVAGATSSALTVANVQSADAGSYTVVATNSLGAATSSAATLSLAVSQPSPSAPSPAPTAASGGGGGGAPSVWFWAALGLLGVLRSTVDRMGGAHVLGNGIRSARD